MGLLGYQRPADILIMALSVLPFLGGMPHFHFEVGLNTPTVVIMLLTLPNLMAIPWQLRWGFRQVVARMLMVSGISMVYAGYFYELLPSSYSGMVAVTLAMVGFVIHMSLIADHEIAVLRSKSEFVVSMKMQDDFYVLNLMSKSVDSEAIRGISKNMESLGYGRTLVGCIPIEPENKQGYFLLGFTLTGQEFLIAGRCHSADEAQERLQYLMSKMEMLRLLFHKRGKIVAADVLETRIAFENFELDLRTDQDTFIAIKFWVRLHWVKEIEKSAS